MNDRDKTIEDALDLLGMYLGACRKEDRRGVHASMTIIKGMRSKQRLNDIEIDNLTRAAGSRYRNPAPLMSAEDADISPSEISHAQGNSRQRDNH